MDRSTADKWADIYRPADIALLSAPFTYPPMPSVALSEFKVILEENGLTAGVIYPMFLMTQLLGAEDTRRLARLNSHYFYQEYCFAHLSGRPAGCSPEDAAALLYPEEEVEEVASLLEKGREAAAIVTDAAARKIIAMDPKVLACSSIYAQLCASLAICRRVKELRPDIRTVIGGFIHAGRGTRILRNYSSVDYVSLGEGDESIADACRVMMGLSEGPMPYGMLCREDLQGLEEIPYRLTRNMNDVPMPDYDDYMEEVRLFDEGFYRVKSSGKRLKMDTRLFLEGSRGCWWGQKHPCSFCALNGLKNVYRQKDADRIYSEIRTIARKYPGVPVQLTDNILSARFIKEILPRMAADDNNYHFFAEIKSNMDDSSMEAFAKAGIYELQPGIESLNDHLLELMGKGNTAINHVNLLKQGSRYGLMIHWNILYGIPGEAEEDYLEMAELFPKLYHFIYPNASSINFYKYSRYDADAEKYGLELVPMKGNEMLYGDDPDTVSDMAFSYDAKGSFARTFEEHLHLYQNIRELAEEWEKLYTSDEPPVLNCTYIGDSVLIRDSRPIAHSSLVHLEGIHADIYRLMEAPVRESLVENSLPQGKYTEKEIRDAIKELENTDLIVNLSGSYLALAVPVRGLSQRRIPQKDRTER